MTSSARRPDSTRIAVFARAPVAGAVKTRLVPLLGPDGAAGLHAGLVRQALATAAQSRAGELELWCAPDEHHPFFDRCASEFGAKLKAQQGADLGERMSYAFDDALGAKAALVLIGSDCPALTGAHLHEAVRTLDSHDAVVAPAEDGGYVLIGLRVAVPSIFAGVSWGSAAVMAETRARLAASGASWKEMPALWDVDRPEDYARLQREGLLREVLS
jgi:hypothetical protein